MIEALAVYGLLAVLAIPASIIGKLVYKEIRRIEREQRREQARQEQEEIAAFYRELILKQIWGDIK